MFCYCVRELEITLGHNFSLFKDEQINCNNENSRNRKEKKGLEKYHSLKTVCLTLYSVSVSSDLVRQPFLVSVNLLYTSRKCSGESRSSRQMRNKNLTLLDVSKAFDLH